MNDRVYYSREAEMRAGQQRMVAVIIFLILGAGMGAILAVMFAPEDMRKTRKQIAEAFEDSVDSGRDRVNRALRRLEKEYPGVRKRFENLVNELV